MRYFSTNRPVSMETLPIGIEVKKVKNFDNQEFIPTIGRKAWGYFITSNILGKDVLEKYELIKEYDFYSFLDDNAKTMRSMAPRCTEQEEEAWEKENKAIISCLDTIYSSDDLIYFVKKESEKLGTIGNEYFAINNDTKPLGEFIENMTAKNGVDFGFNKKDLKISINLYQSAFSKVVEGEEYCGYNMEKYKIYKTQKKILSKRIFKYIHRRFIKGDSVVLIPESFYAEGEKCIA